MPKYTKKDKQQNVIKEIYLRSDIRPYTKRTTLETKLQQMDEKNIFNANEVSIAKKEYANQTLSTIEQINNSIDDGERMKALERNIDNYVESHQPNYVETHQPKQLQPLKPRQQIIQKKSISDEDSKSISDEDSSKFLISISKVDKICKSDNSLSSKLSSFNKKEKSEVKKETKSSFKDKYNNNQNVVNRNVSRKRERINNKKIIFIVNDDSKKSGCCCF